MTAKHRKLIPLIVAIAPWTLSAQPPETAPLTADDLVQIRQLLDSYAQTLDHCTNDGRDYADLFTDDATFGVSSEWGGGQKIWFRGRAQLVQVGGSGCRAPQSPTPSYHLNLNPRIWATPDGAAARSTLLTITNDTNARGDVIHYEGGYEDTFEKTPHGWRFKSRVHVWTEVAWTENPADMPARKIEDE